MFDYNDNIYVYIQSYNDVTLIFDLFLTKYNPCNWKSIIDNMSEQILSKIINILGGIKNGIQYNINAQTNIEFFYHNKKIMYKDAFYGYLLNYAGNIKK